MTAIDTDENKRAECQGYSAVQNFATPQLTGPPWPIWL
jgi:hypothetical protein